MRIGNRGLDRAGPIGHDRNLDRGRQPFLQLRQRRTNARSRIDHVGASFALNEHEHCRPVIVPARDFVVGDAGHYARNITQSNKRVISMNDRQFTVFLGAEQLIVDRYALGFRRAFNGAFRSKGVCPGNGDPDVIQSDPERSEHRRIRTHSDGEFLRALKCDPAHSLDLGKPLHDHPVDVVVDHARRQCIAGNCKEDNRHQRWIELVDLWSSRHVLGQLGRRRVHRGLNVGCGSCDVPSRAELCRDVGCAEHVERRELREAGNLPNAPFERSCNRCRHGLRAGARQQCRYHYGRQIDRGQGRHGQPKIGDRPDQDCTNRDQ